MKINLDQAGLIKAIRNHLVSEGLNLTDGQELSVEFVNKRKPRNVSAVVEIRAAGETQSCVEDHGPVLDLGQEGAAPRTEETIKVDSTAETFKEAEVAQETENAEAPVTGGHAPPAGEVPLPEVGEDKVAEQLPETVEVQEAGKDQPQTVTETKESLFG